MGLPSISVSFKEYFSYFQNNVGKWIIYNLMSHECDNHKNNIWFSRDISLVTNVQNVYDLFQFVYVFFSCQCADFISIYKRNNMIDIHYSYYIIGIIDVLLYFLQDLCLTKLIYFIVQKSIYFCIIHLIVNVYYISALSAWSLCNMMNCARHGKTVIIEDNDDIRITKLRIWQLTWMIYF